MDGKNNTLVQNHIIHTKMPGWLQVVVDSFCHQGGGCFKSSTKNRVKFRKLLSLLIAKCFFHRRKDRLYDVCMQSAMLHSNETWRLKVED